MRVKSSRRGTLKIQQRLPVSSASHEDNEPTSSSSCRLTVVAFDRPDVKNAFNDDVYLDILDILNETKSDPTSSGIILTGVGPYFTSGADLKSSFSSVSSEASTRRSPPSSTTAAKTDLPTSKRPTGRFMLALLDYPKLLCAAVNGPAVGIGTTLLFHCDLVFACPESTFWAPFTRIALVPELCSSVTFVQTMGLSRANELLLLGRSIDSQTAHSWGICSRIIPQGQDDDPDRCLGPANTTGTSAPTILDPFDPLSLSSKMAIEIETNLLSLPESRKTVHYFVSMIRKSGRGKSFLRRVCLDELRCLDERRSSGDMDIAISALRKSLQKKKKQKLNQRQKKDLSTGRQHRSKL